MSRHACMSAQMSSPPAPALTAVLLLCPHFRPFRSATVCPKGLNPGKAIAKVKQIVETGKVV